MNTQRKVYEIGHRWGSLSYIGDAEDRLMPCGTRKRMVNVRCDCGREYAVQHGNLIGRKVSRCRNCAAKTRPRPGPTFTNGEVNRKQAYKAYERGARKRGLVFEITMDDFLNLAKQRCFYCDSPPSNTYYLKKSDGTARSGEAFVYTGIDRIDSSIGYTRDNTIPCCRRCNVSKSDQDVRSFVLWVESVYANLRAKGVL